MIKRIVLCSLGLMAGARATAEWIELPLPELTGEYFYDTHRLAQLDLPAQVESLDSAWIRIRGFAAPGLLGGDGVEIPWEDTFVLIPQAAAFFPPGAPCCIMATTEELDGDFNVVAPFHRYFQVPFDFLLTGPTPLRLSIAAVLGWYIVVQSPYLRLDEVSFIARVFPDLPPIQVGIQATGAGILLSWEDTLHGEWAIHRLDHPLALPTEENRIATVRETRFFDERALERDSGFYVVCPSFDRP